MSRYISRNNYKGAIFIELKRKPAELLIRAACGFLALLTLFLLTMSLIFSFGGDAPSLFGKNIYIVKTAAVEDLEPGMALVTSKVPFDEIVEGDIVVFQNSDNRAGVAEITATRYNDNVYGFTAISERGAELSLTQSQIIGKAVYYSAFLGGLISFVKSPAGVLVIAVIPCLIILVHESARSVLAKARKEKEVIPVRKQEEIPTYIPRQKMSAAISAYSKTEAIPDFSGFSDEESDKAEGAKSAESVADKADRIVDRVDRVNDITDDFPLFRPPSSRPQRKPPTPKAPIIPLSQKRLNEAMAAVNAQKGITPRPENENENVKQYLPKKNPAPISQTAAMPSLDRLLREED